MVCDWFNAKWLEKSFRCVIALNTNFFTKSTQFAIKYVRLYMLDLNCKMIRIFFIKTVLNRNLFFSNNSKSSRGKALKKIHISFKT